MGGWAGGCSLFGPWFVDMCSWGATGLRGSQSGPHSRITRAGESAPHAISLRANPRNLYISGTAPQHTSATHRRRSGYSSGGWRYSTGRGWARAPYRYRPPSTVKQRFGRSGEESDEARNPSSRNVAGPRGIAPRWRLGSWVWPVYLTLFCFKIFISAKMRPRCICKPT